MTENVMIFCNEGLFKKGENNVNVHRLYFIDSFFRFNLCDMCLQYHECGKTVGLSSYCYVEIKIDEIKFRYICEI